MTDPITVNASIGIEWNDPPPLVPHPWDAFGRPGPDRCRCETFWLIRANGECSECGLWAARDPDDCEEA